MNTKRPLAWIKEGDCIRCISHSSDTGGYPRMNRGGRMRSIARHILVRRLGELPREIVCRHTCDNQWCINPAHIVHGLQADNMHDMKVRGRAFTWRGEKHPSAKLTQKQVDKIRDLLLYSDASQEEIGILFGVSQRYISDIKNRKTWNC